MSNPFPDSHSKPSRDYDETFQSSEEYRESLPDIQNAHSDYISGAKVAINQVGISNFKLPLNFRTKDGGVINLETSVTGTVSLAKDNKGINMSRILRVFYEFKDDVFSWNEIEKILRTYLDRLSSQDARLKLFFNYPISQTSLRSELAGFQYYQVMMEGVMSADGHFHRNLQVDFVYSSACPCSDMLSEHAREERGTYGIPHSQRSKARILAELAEGVDLPIEDLVSHCANALKTETQVMVRREDEQAFAELNGAYIKFVEDAARLVYEGLDTVEEIVDFQVSIAHLESLHSHDAVAVITKGIPNGFRGDFEDFRNLIC
ncbi:GTP cyclohydrolase I FolE2 [Opitutia bacterium ISCC 51]|nr:GTP cyclohydrolase I FolE2 [Opitutae bacterium ISCC 51]QXD28153.1 GTP cyclohydrolase I FolE2 [Opitutae bacterium ISCC 52]